MPLLPSVCTLIFVAFLDGCMLSCFCSHRLGGSKESRIDRAIIRSRISPSSYHPAISGEEQPNHLSGTILQLSLAEKSDDDLPQVPSVRTEQGG